MDDTRYLNYVAVLRLQLAIFTGIRSIYYRFKDSRALYLYKNPSIIDGRCQ